MQENGTQFGARVGAVAQCVGLSGAATGCSEGTGAVVRHKGLTSYWRCSGGH